MRVISISRRTDIPAFYSSWLLNRLRAGFCHVANPFNQKITRVSLLPEDCLALVFWTRNPAPLLPHLDALRQTGYRFYTHVTLTGYPSLFEPYSPSLDVAIAGFQRLAEAVGPEFVIWRYDPIFLSDLTPAEYHLRQFALLAERLQGTTRQCITSFTAFYQKTTRNLSRLAQQHNFTWQEPDAESKRKLAESLADIAGEHNIALSACCDADLVSERISQAHCVDPTLIARLRPDVPVPCKRAPSRPGCGCVESVDIGAYDTCAFGCAYCYATQTRSTGLQRLRDHDPDDSLLWRPPALHGHDLTDVPLASSPQVPLPGLG